MMSSLWFLEGGGAVKFFLWSILKDATFYSVLCDPLYFAAVLTESELDCIVA